MSTEDFMLCESQTSTDLDGFETIDVRSIDLQEIQNKMVEHVVIVVKMVIMLELVKNLVAKKSPQQKNLKRKKPKKAKKPKKVKKAKGI